MILDDKPHTQKEPAMNTKTFHKHVALAAVAALCFATATVYAGEANETQTRTVRYADLDVGTPAGAAALHDRIRNAAEQVCGDTNSRQLVEAMAAKACVARAVAAGEQTVHKARLASIRQATIR
jgi:UrcA family protein